jgi:uncharacterized protein HemX
MSDPLRELRQELDKLSQRVADVATAFSHMRAEVDANTASVRDFQLWVVHRPLERDPQLNTSTPFEG